jgi:hypothetical protein
VVASQGFASGIEEEPSEIHGITSSRSSPSMPRHYFWQAATSVRTQPAQETILFAGFFISLQSLLTFKITACFF